MFCTEMACMEYDYPECKLTMDCQLTEVENEMARENYDNFLTGLKNNKNLYNRYTKMTEEFDQNSRIVESIIPNPYNLSSDEIMRNLENLNEMRKDQTKN